MQSSIYYYINDIYCGRFYSEIDDLKIQFSDNFDSIEFGTYGTTYVKLIHDYIRMEIKGNIPENYHVDIYTYEDIL